jgi:hypothetical protein
LKKKKAVVARVLPAAILGRLTASFDVAVGGWRWIATGCASTRRAHTRSSPTRPSRWAASCSTEPESSSSRGGRHGLGRIGRRVAQLLQGFAVKLVSPTTRSMSPYRNGSELPIQGQENLAILTITIIFALLVALWGRLGGAGASRA